MECPHLGYFRNFSPGDTLPCSILLIAGPLDSFLIIVKETDAIAIVKAVDVAGLFPLILVSHASSRCVVA